MQALPRYSKELEAVPARFAALDGNSVNALLMRVKRFAAEAEGTAYLQNWSWPSE